MRYFVDAKSEDGKTAVYRSMDMSELEENVPALLETGHSVRLYKLVPVTFERRTTIYIKEEDGG